jgi:hypothetical protein
MPRSRALLVLAVASPLVVPAAATATQTTYAPRCVAPGGASSVAVDYTETSLQSRQRGHVVLVPQVLKDGSPSLLPEAQHAIRREPGPITYAPSTALPGTLVPQFRQTFAIPPGSAIAGLPLLGYTVRVQATDATGATSYGFDNTYAYLQVDLRRILASTKRAPTGGSLPLYVTGLRAAKTYLHLVSSKGKRLRRVALRGGVAPNTACGQSYVQLSLRGAKPGKWRVVANASRSSTSAVGGAAITIRVTR